MVALAPERAQMVGAQAATLSCVPRARRPRWVPRVEPLAHEVEDAAHRLVVAAANLLQLDVAHLLELGIGESWVEQHVRDELQRAVQAVADDLRGVAGDVGPRLTPRRAPIASKSSVSWRTSRCSVPWNIMSESRLREPQLILRLLFDSRGELHAEGDRGQARHPLADELQAIGKVWRK